MWRREKLYAYVQEAGITRGRADRATLNPALEAIDRIERQIIETMRQLAMLPKQAADLGGNTGATGATETDRRKADGAIPLVSREKSDQRRPAKMVAMHGPRFESGRRLSQRRS
jgi:hypothetical protein